MTTRPLSSALATEIQQPVVRPVLLYEGEFASPGSETPSFLRLWSGVGDLSWDGKTWTGAGHLLGLSPLGENTELRAEGFTVSLAGMTTEAVSRALQEVRQGKPGKLWIGAMRAEAYLELPGVTGNYASTPDSAALAPSQNWVPYSEDLTAWGNAGFNLAAPVANVYADPSGAVTVGTLEDDAAAEYEVRRAVQATIPNDGATYQIAFIVRKDFAATHRAGVNFRCQSGGTQVTTVMRFALDGTNASACTVTSYDADYWLVAGTVTNNSSGNVLLTADFFPAVSTTKGGGDNPSGVGTTAFGWVRVQRSNTLLPYLKTTGTANKGAFEVRAKVRFIDWTPPTTNRAIVGRYSGASNSEFLFECNTGGSLLLYLRDSGGAPAGSHTSTVGHGFLDGGTYWVRFAVDYTALTLRFYTSTDYDPVTGAGTWTQLGATLSITKYDLANTNLPVTLGVFGTGSDAMEGGIYHAEIRNGIDGPVVARFDPRRFTAGQSTAVMETGETWTLNTSGGTPARIVPAGEVLVGDPYLIQEGRFDIASLEDPGNGPCVISAAYEGELIDLDRPRERRWTPEDQALDYSGDQGFDQVAQLQDASFVWGR